LLLEGTKLPYTSAAGNPHEIRVLEIAILAPSRSAVEVITRSAM